MRSVARTVFKDICPALPRKRIISTATESSTPAGDSSLKPAGDFDKCLEVVTHLRGRTRAAITLELIALGG
jgi:hypothetical protein